MKYNDKKNPYLTILMEYLPPEAHLLVEITRARAEAYEEGYKHALRDVEGEIKLYKGRICPNCGPLDGREVTYEETCDHCGADVG